MQRDVQTVAEDWNCSEGEGRDGQQRERTINDNVHMRLDQRHGDKMPNEQCRALIDRLDMNVSRPKLNMQKLRSQYTVT